MQGYPGGGKRHKLELLSGEQRSGGIPGTENLVYRTWELRGGSLVYLRSGPDAGFYRMTLTDGKMGAARRVGEAPRRLLLGPGTMSVSPDSRTVLYTSEDLTIGDIYVLAPSKGGG